MNEPELLVTVKQQYGGTTRDTVLLHLRKEKRTVKQSCVFSEPDIPRLTSRVSDLTDDDSGLRRENLQVPPGRIRPAKRCPSVIDVPPPRQDQVFDCVVNCPGYEPTSVERCTWNTEERDSLHDVSNLRVSRPEHRRQKDLVFQWDLVNQECLCYCDVHYNPPRPACSLSMARIYEEVIDLSSASGVPFLAQWRLSCKLPIPQPFAVHASDHLPHLVDGI